VSDVREAFELYAEPKGLLEGAKYLPEHDAYDWPTANEPYQVWKAARAEFSDHRKVDPEATAKIKKTISEGTVVFSDTAQEIEDRLQHEIDHACPYCCGSGHKDDVALQSQTAPAVPDGWKLVPIRPTQEMLASAVPAAVALVDQGPEKNEQARIQAELYAGKRRQEVAAYYRAMLTAAPSPDHIADAGKVGPVGWIWETYGQRNFTAGTHHKNVLEADGLTLIPVYPHPAQPRNEVQAEALEEYAKALDQVFASAQEANANKCPAWHAGQFAKDARKFAARLRSNGGDV